jgi:hypothetical protein
VTGVAGVVVPDAVVPDAVVPDAVVPVTPPYYTSRSHGGNT